MSLVKSKSFPIPIVLIAIVLSITVPTAIQSHSCKPQKLGNEKTYALCETLPAFKSELHYTYNATNGSLSIAFVATPSKRGGWISWAINPTSTGMIGAQAFVAYQFNKSIKTTTLNISSYKSLVPGNLAFKFWDVSAEKMNDVITLYASLSVPENKTVVNQVWQVGPGVDANGMILPHPFVGENLMSKSELSLNGAPVPSAAPSPGPSLTSVPSPAPGGHNGSLRKMMKVSGGFDLVVLCTVMASLCLLL